MHRVSIVIVNYNVRYFLRQCIQSILSSRTEAELEIIVVDNASLDGSVEMLKQEFPEIVLVSNTDNKGFSRANNQGFALATGDYVLILNPDTIIEEQTIQQCLEYYISHPGTGAIGVRMVDGSGKYLPESRRGFPTPANAFFKLSGLSKLFPGASRWNGYYQGGQQADKAQEMDVLSGAFVFTTKAILDEIGGFDEDYFMYGEDIEMSYQIKKLNRPIVYLPYAQIIHFKGESTRKSSLNYIRRFYGAMYIYAQKRHSSSPWIWKWVLNTGIVMAAVSSYFRSVFRFLLWPLLNMLIVFFYTKGLQYLWASVYYKDSDYYSAAESDISIGVLSTGLVVCYYIFGQFDKRYTTKQWLYGGLISAFVSLSMYALFPMHMRFSRSILLLLVFTSPLVMLILRRISNRIRTGSWSEESEQDRSILVIGSEASCLKVKQIIDRRYAGKTGVDHLDTGDFNNPPDLVEAAAQMVRLKNIDELIFCSADISTERVFELIAKLPHDVDFKIASNDSSSILGSHSRNAVGEWFTLDIEFKINRTFHKRTKRLIDIGMCVFLPILFPYFIIGGRGMIYRHWLGVLFGRESWLGYRQDDPYLNKLPKLKPAIFEFRQASGVADPSEIHRQNLFYAQHYSIWLETEKLFRLLFRIDKV